MKHCKGRRELREEASAQKMPSFSVQQHPRALLRKFTPSSNPPPHQSDAIVKWPRKPTRVACLTNIQAQNPITSSGNQKGQSGNLARNER